MDFLAEVFGDDAEIVLHDMTDMDGSVVAIRNNHISGRKVGAPATNMALKIINAGNYKTINYLTNYKGVSKEGKTLKSSTFFIKDDQQQLIGMLCINIDLEKIFQFHNYLDKIIHFWQENDDQKTEEYFGSSVEEIALDSIETAIKNSGVSPERLSQDEKIAIIRELHNDGVFLLKGSVSEVAAQFKVSEATIYRYLNKIKKEQ
jgi:predicted transcriptional regulator YheO